MRAIIESLRFHETEIRQLPILCDGTGGFNPRIIVQDRIGSHVLRQVPQRASRAPIYLKAEALKPFARQLERKLNEARAINADLEEALNTIKTYCFVLAPHAGSLERIAHVAEEALTKSKESRKD